MRGNEEEGMKGTVAFFEIINISCKPSHPCLLRTRKRKKHEGEINVACTQQSQKVSSRFSSLARGEKKKTYLEIRQANPNWIKSIWILLSVLFFFFLQYTQYYPPFPVTVSWAVCITQLFAKILQSCGIDSGAAIIEPPMQNNDVPIVAICASESASTSRAWLSLGGRQGKGERLGGPLDRQSMDEFRHSDRGQSLRLVLNADYNLHSSGEKKIKSRDEKWKFKGPILCKTH